MAGVSAVKGLLWLESSLLFLFLPGIPWECSFGGGYVRVGVVREKAYSSYIKMLYFFHS